MNENLVELVSYHGGDLLHTSSVEGYLCENTGQLEKTNRFLKYLYESNLLSNYRKSYIQFKLTTDYTTYINFCNNVDARNITSKIFPEGMGYRNNHDVTYYIPPDYPMCVTSSDVVDEDGKVLYKRGTNYFDLLNDYTKLGMLLNKFVKKDLKNKLPAGRIWESSTFFHNLSTQVTYDVTFNFIEFVQFYQKASSSYSSQEYQQVAEYMVSLLKDIPHNPFRITLKLFEL